MYVSVSHILYLCCIIFLVGVVEVETAKKRSDYGTTRSSIAVYCLIGVYCLIYSPSYAEPNVTRIHKVHCRPTVVDRSAVP